MDLINWFFLLACIVSGVIHMCKNRPPDAIDFEWVCVRARVLWSRDFKVCHLGGVVACILTLLYMCNVSIVKDWTSFTHKGILLDEHNYFADGFALSASVVSLFAGDTTTTLKAMYGVALIAMGGWVYACSYVNTLEDWAHMTAFRFLPYMGSAVTNKAELRGNYTPVWVVVTVVHVLLLHVALHIFWKAGQSAYKPAGGWTTRGWPVYVFVIMGALYHYTEPVWWSEIDTSAFCAEGTDPRCLHQVSMCVKGCVVAGLHGVQIYLTSSGEGAIAEGCSTAEKSPEVKAAEVAVKKLQAEVKEAQELDELSKEKASLEDQKRTLASARLQSPRASS